jgi:DNA-binding response OmpR family regulator
MPSKILVVEDSPELRRAAKVALEARGYEVVCSEDGQDGLADFLAHKPDLVLLDIRMPRISGIELCGLIRHRSRVPIVMYSAVEDRDDVIRAIRNGATDYVLKDTGIMEVLERVGGHLAQAEVALKSEQEPAGRPSQDAPVQLFSLKKGDRATAILVHSDEEARAQLLPMMQRTGRQVVEAATSDEGIEAIRTQNPDLVLREIRMPRISGSELCGLIRHRSRVPIVMYSAG